MRATGGMNMMISRIPFARLRLDPAGQLERLPMAGLVVGDAEAMRLDEVFRAARDNGGKVAGRELKRFAVGTIDLASPP